MGSVNLDAAIQFALEIGKIQSKSEVDISKSTAGIDAFLLRNTQGATIASISKRVLKEKSENAAAAKAKDCLLYTSPSPRDQRGSRMPSSA